MTADDFGASSQVNAAVARAYQQGILRFASVMTAGDAFEEAVELSRRDCRGLGMGLHVTLCSARSLLGPEPWQGWVGEDGSFPQDPAWCGVRYFFDTSLHPLLEKEMRAQFEKFLGSGLQPSHVDAHANIHVHPVIFPVLMRLCREYGFPRVRVPGGEVRACLSYARSRAGMARLLESAVFALLRRYLLRAWADPGIEVVDRVYGMMRSGLMTEDYVLHCLKTLPEGSTEMYFHPSADPSSAADQRPTPTHRSITELETLLSPKIREALQQEGIELLSA